MERLHDEFNGLGNTAEAEPLLLIAAYALDFLCIHPFLDGNGRMARLLVLLLLYTAGFEVGRFISLERIIEQSREGYYDSLYASSQGWHDGRHSLQPWNEHLFGVLVAACREFEDRVGILTVSRGAKTAMVLEAVRHLPETFRMTDVEHVCPNVGRDMIRKVLRKLKKEGAVKVEGKGLAAVWREGGTIP